LCLSVFVNFFAISAHAAGPQVSFKTNLGEIVVELNNAGATRTVDNFLNYVRSGFYDGTVFHRVIPNFMIQGGGFNQTMQQKTTSAPVMNEAATSATKNEVGTIAMARTNDPNSATAQFFINVAHNEFLNARPGNPGYTAFGRVIKGMDVVNKIAAVKTGSGGPFPQDVPQQSVIIEKATLLSKDK